MDVDNFLKVAERLGIPAALVFAGLYLGWRFVAAIGPAAGSFLNGLTAKLEAHSLDHAKLDGKLDAHHEKVAGKLDTQHEKTAAAIRQSEARVRSEVDRVRGDLMRAFDAATDRIVDTALRPPGPDSGVHVTTITPVEGTQRTPRQRREDIAIEDTQESP